MIEASTIQDLILKYDDKRIESQAKPDGRSAVLAYQEVIKDLHDLIRDKPEPVTNPS